MNSGSNGAKDGEEDGEGKEEGALLPDFGDSVGVNFEVAVAVAERAIEEGVANVEWGKECVREEVAKRKWEPVYGEYEFDKGEEMLLLSS